MIEHNDANLVRRCLAGETKAFEALVEKYQKTIFNVVYRITKNHDDAEDITQVVFIKAYEKLITYKPKFKFFSWLYRIALNEALNYLNQKKQLEELDTNIISPENSAEEAYIEAELSEQIQDGLMQLNLNYRIIIILRHFQNCSYQDIGYILDIPEKTVKSRLFTARQLLKNVLIEKGVGLNNSVI